MMLCHPGVFEEDGAKFAPRCAEVVIAGIEVEVEMGLSPRMEFEESEE